LLCGFNVGVKGLTKRMYKTATIVEISFFSPCDYGQAQSRDTSALPERRCIILMAQVVLYNQSPVSYGSGFIVCSKDPTNVSLMSQHKSST